MKRMMVWLVLLGLFAASVPVGTRADGNMHVKMIEAFGKARDEIHDVLKVMGQQVVALKENQKAVFDAHLNLVKHHQDAREYIIALEARVRVLEAQVEHLERHD